MRDLRAEGDRAAEIDPILAVVLGKKIEAIAKDMSLVLERTSRSPLFQVKDFCTAVLDERARILSQEEGLPQMAYAIVHSLKHLIDFFGEDIHAGDVFIQNDPYYGGNHAPDTCIFHPVIVDRDHLHVFLQRHVDPRSYDTNLRSGRDVATVRPLRRRRPP